MSIKRNDRVNFLKEIDIIRAKLDEKSNFKYDEDWQHNNTLELLNNTVDKNGNTIWNYIIKNEEKKSFRVFTS